MPQCSSMERQRKLPEMLRHAASLALGCLSALMMSSFFMHLAAATLLASSAEDTEQLLNQDQSLCTADKGHFACLKYLALEVPRVSFLVHVCHAAACVRQGTVIRAAGHSHGNVWNVLRFVVEGQRCAAAQQLGCAACLWCASQQACGKGQCVWGCTVVCRGSATCRSSATWPSCSHQSKQQWWLV